MPTTKIIAAAALLLAATGGAALAHDTDAIDATRARQARVIEEGRYSGELTRREYRDLRAEQARIAELERQAKADGYVTGREVHEIRDAQRAAARHIATETHNGDVSFWRRWLYRNRY